MLGDANALVAALVAGREAQHLSTVAMAAMHGRLVIGEAVLGEACWVLERTYEMSRGDVALLVREALDSEDFIAWDPELAYRALIRMHASPRFALVDCLLIERAAAGETVFTHDRALARAIARL